VSATISLGWKRLTMTNTLASIWTEIISLLKKYFSTYKFYASLKNITRANTLAYLATLQVKKVA